MYKFHHSISRSCNITLCSVNFTKGRNQCNHINKAMLLVYFTIISTLILPSLTTVLHSYKSKVVADVHLEIVNGTSDCITNCSQMSSRQNVFMQCSIDDCSLMQTESIAPQPAEIDNRKDVRIEIYKDKSDGRDRLALYIAWSPVDNVFVDRTTGYEVSISDGISSYHQCYFFKTPMKFDVNIKDVYYNDCFGKASGTRVRLGSEIEVNITTLPLWEVGSHHGLITRIIKVPDCSNEYFHSLEECQKLDHGSSVDCTDENFHSLDECKVPGGRPTTKPCISDTCHTQSHMNGVSHDINCTVSKYDIKNFRGAELCDKVNKTTNGSPSSARRVPREQEWYKFIDGATGEVKVALNFSWMPAPDSAIESLHAYYVEVLPKHATATFFNKCFAIHTPLYGDKHTNASFYYDCYGRVRGMDVYVGMTYLIHIQSRPIVHHASRNDIQFIISVPGCDDERMQDVTICEVENSKKSNITIEEIYCANNSVKLSYNLTAYRNEAKTADVYLCYGDANPLQCRGKHHVAMEGIQLSGTLYNISFHSHVNKSANLSIILETSLRRRRRTYFSFSECNVEEKSNTLLISLITVVSVLCVVGMVFFICYFNKDCNFPKGLLASYKGSTERRVAVGIGNDSIHNQEQSAPVMEDEPPIPKKMRVYVIFMDDHELHKNVVHWFCAYLKQDLGLDVRLHIWQPAEVALNPVHYMKTNIKLAEKVIIICSEGTRNCLEKKEYDGDMFTPVIIEVYQHAFLGQNPGKFLVGYFPYSKPEDVPEMLHDQCVVYFSLFKLMKQFEQLYFRLVGLEQFQQGKIYRIDKIAFDRYYDPGLTSCGMKLKQSIDQMVEFVKKNPTWYTDESGSDLPIANISPIPLLLSLQKSTADSSILQQVPGQASIRYITTNPPPDLPNGYMTSFQPQLPNADPASALNRGYIPGMQPKLTAGSAAADIKTNANEQQQIPMKYSKKTAQQPYLYENYNAPKSASSSFVLPETDNDNFSSVSADAEDSPHNSEECHSDYTANRAFSIDYSESNPQSFHPESFNDQDFTTTDYEDNSLECPQFHSNLTQVTVLGLSESQEKLAKSLHTNCVDYFHEGDGADNGPKLSPESGVFNLANLDENVDDIEDEFKSINLSKFHRTAIL